MIQKSICFWKDFLTFILKGKVNAEQGNLRDFMTVLFFAFFMGSILLWYGIKMLEQFGFFAMPQEKEFEFGKAYAVFSIVILSPLIEELIFRYPLRHFYNSRFFLPVLHPFVFVFAAIHLTNYQRESLTFFSGTAVILSPLYGAYLLSFTRLKYGFFWSLGVHMAYNSLSYVWGLLVGF